eukprot:s2658_g1.t1
MIKGSLGEKLWPDLAAKEEAADAVAELQHCLEVKTREVAALRLEVAKAQEERDVVILQLTESEENDLTCYELEEWRRGLRQMQAELQEARPTLTKTRLQQTVETPARGPRYISVSRGMLSLVPVAVIVVFLTQHVVSYAGDIQSFVTMVWRFCKDSAVRYLWPPRTKACQHQQRREQIEAAMWEVRARTYRQSVQFMVHAAAFGVVGMTQELYLNPSWNEMFSLFSMAFVYVAHHSVCKGKLKLNAMNLRGIYMVFYTSFFLFVLAKSSSKTALESGRAVIDQGFNSGSRMIMSVIFIDTLTALPAQLMISLAETVVHAKHSQSTEEILLFAWMQIIVSAGIIGFSVVLEFWVTSHLTSLMDTESMVCSFRRMLRGVSDGEVMLSEDLRIAEDSDCLKHLLMTQSKFKGKDFERLLVEEEVDRFQEFMKQSMAEAHKPEEQRTKTPPCLRISLRGASDLRVGVDVWHVSMPGRKDGVRHLLALREDSEARCQAPDACGCLVKW